MILAPSFVPGDVTRYFNRVSLSETSSFKHEKQISLDWFILKNCVLVSQCFSNSLSKVIKHLQIQDTTVYTADTKQKGLICRDNFVEGIVKGRSSRLHYNGEEIIKRKITNGYIYFWKKKTYFHLKNENCLGVYWRRVRILFPSTREL